MIRRPDWFTFKNIGGFGLVMVIVIAVSLALTGVVIQIIKLFE